MSEFDVVLNIGGYDANSGVYRLAGAAKGKKEEIKGKL